MRGLRLVLRVLAVSCFGVAAFGFATVIWSEMELWWGGKSRNDFYPFGPDFWLVPAVMLSVIGAAFLLVSVAIHHREPPRRRRVVGDEGPRARGPR